MWRKVAYRPILVWSIILFLLPLPLIQALALGLPSLYAQEALAIQFGSVAYVWWLVAVYLSTRPHWLDRLIGLPSLYFIHGTLSLMALLLAYLHKTQTFSAGWIRRTGDWSFDLFVGLMAYALLFLAGWLTARSRLLTRLKRGLERLFHHELSVWIHRLMLVALGLAFIHVQLISYITSITSYIWLFNGYTAVVAALYLWQKATHVWRLPAAKLVAKRELAPNFYAFTLQLRHPYRTHLAPGDYLFLNFPTHDGLREGHPFSVVNAVTDDGEVVLAIRGDGDFTRAIQTLEPGAVARIEGGYGRFTPVIRANAHDDLVLIAGGSGVVPMLALSAAHPTTPITLYYSAHTTAALIYADELTRLAAKRPNLTVHLQAGRFPVAQTLPQVLAPQTTYLLSGPRALGRSWERALLRDGVARQKVYYEEFNW